MSNGIPTFSSSDLIFGQGELLKALVTHLAGTGLVSVDAMRSCCSQAAQSADRINLGKPLRAGEYLRHVFDNFPWEEWTHLEAARRQRQN